MKWSRSFYRAEWSYFHKYKGDNLVIPCKSLYTKAGMPWFKLRRQVI